MTHSPVRLLVTRAIRVGAVVLLALALAGCGRILGRPGASGAQLPTEPPGITGSISTVEPAAGGDGVVALVELSLIHT
ncbi:MAG: hypothetical protein FDZ75_06915, partial [Actinobacteria bacterium]